MAFFRKRLKAIVVLLSILFVITIAMGGRWFYKRYQISNTMTIPVTEFSNSEYPEDPSNRSIHYGRYSGRELMLVKRDETHFDFVFQPSHKHVAKVIFKNIDLSLFVPTAPAWTKNDPGLEKIAFVDREWNRQQVSFRPQSKFIEVRGGNGFEKTNIFSAEIARNCLNAGLWEVLLFTQENGQKALYYQGWFNFPLGHYKQIFERENQISYWKHWWSLEHWVDPVGTRTELSQLRRVLSEEKIKANFVSSEQILALGEQQRKARTAESRNLITWTDVFSEKKIQFAAFIPPGRYSLKHLRNNEYWRMAKFDKIISRNVQSPATEQSLLELELVFVPKSSKDQTRIIVSGIDIDVIPQLKTSDYSKGLYMPMGIGVPPFFQSYEELSQKPPFHGPYFSVMLDSKDRWLNHHDIAIDGPIIHRDIDNPQRLHIYLLSYERHLLAGHFVADLKDSAEKPVAKRSETQGGTKKS